MRKLALLILLTSTPANAVEVTITLTDEHQRMFLMVLEAAANSTNVKPGGLEMAKMVALMNNILAAAQVRLQYIPQQQIPEGR